MRSTSRFAITALSVALFAVATASADPVIFDNGGPNLANGNEVCQWVQTEDFMLREDTLLTDAHFWTIEDIVFGNGWDGTLDWYVFADAGGTPAGSPLASGSGVNVSRVATGNIALGFFTEYEWDFDLDTPVSLSGGTTYWFGLHLSSNFDRDEIYWETTDGGFGHQGSTGMESDQGTFDNWFDNGQQHAFYLTGVVPEPSSFALVGLGALGLVGLWRRSR